MGKDACLCIFVRSQCERLQQVYRFEAVFVLSDACRAKYALLLFIFAVNELVIVYPAWLHTARWRAGYDEQDG